MLPLGDSLHRPTRLFNQLRNLQQGPADRMSKAMKQGDFKKALEELNKLQQKRMLEEKLARKRAQQLEKLEKKQAVEERVRTFFSISPVDALRAE